MSIETPINAPYFQEIIDILNSTAPAAEKVERLDSYHDFELGQALPELDDSLRDRLFQLFSAEQLANVFAHAETEKVVPIIKKMPLPIVQSLFNAMQPDDLADIILEFNEREERVTYLSQIRLEKRVAIKNLINYDETVVGSFMNTNYVQLSKTMTVKLAIKHLVETAPATEFINNLYIVENGILIGALSLKEIISAGNKPETLISEIMSVNLITVLQTTTNGEAIETMTNYDFLLLPVVDRDFRMLGIISFDDMAEVMSDESDTDYSRLAGVTDATIDEEGETVFESVKKRLPWLVILLIFDLVTSSIVAGFESTLVLIPTLALFMPLILNMAGNTGTQSLGVIIQQFATNQLETKAHYYKHLINELLTGIINGVLIGVLLFGTVLAFRMIEGQSFSAVLPFAFVISVTIAVSLAVSTIAGAAVPILMKLVKVDPAVASGPFITTINDILSLLIYFGLASLMLGSLLH